MAKDRARFNFPAIWRQLAVAISYSGANEMWRQSFVPAKPFHGKIRPVIAMHEGRSILHAGAGFGLRGSIRCRMSANSSRWRDRQVVSRHTSIPSATGCSGSRPSVPCVAAPDPGPVAARLALRGTSRLLISCHLFRRQRDTDHKAHRHRPDWLSFQMCTNNTLTKITRIGACY